MYNVYYVSLLLVYKNFLVHFSLDPKLLNSIRRMKRNFLGGLIV